MPINYELFAYSAPQTTIPVVNKYKVSQSLHGLLAWEIIPASAGRHAKNRLLVVRIAHQNGLF
ncbi:MAG: hypothetical protein ACI88A_000716 [Paraglaciecola sp.]|jgi:hypothetical protein